MSQLSASPSEYADDHIVRIMNINEEEQAIIRVRTKFHVSLVFSRMTLEVFEKDGVIYTRQEVNGGDVDDDMSINEPEYGSDLETQPIDYEEKKTNDEFITPPVVSMFAGGNFEQVNEKHASRMEGITDNDSIIQNLSFFEIKEEIEEDDWCAPGGTQIDYFGYDNIQAIADTQYDDDETQDE